MATQVAKYRHLTVNSVNFSAHIESCSVTRTKDTPEDTSMGDDSRSYLAEGLKGATIEVVFNADYAAAQTDASLDVIYDLTTVAAFILRPHTDAKGSTNPEFTGNCILTSYGVLDGSVGDTAKQSASFLVTGDVTRAV